jgi:hypothetical protein
LRHALLAARARPEPPRDPPQAFVVFENSDEARRATQKDRETFGEKFGDRYVRVYPTLESDVADMHAAVALQGMAPVQVSPRLSPGRRRPAPASGLPGTPAPDSPSTPAHPPTHPRLRSHPQGGHSHVHMDSVVKMKSLPFDSTQLDIIHFFESYKLKPNGVQLVVRSDNKPTGEVGGPASGHDPVCALSCRPAAARRCSPRRQLPAGRRAHTTPGPAPSRTPAGVRGL